MPTKDITDFGPVSPGGDITTAVLNMFHDPHGTNNPTPGHVAIPPGNYLWNGAPLGGPAVTIGSTDPSSSGHVLLTCLKPLLDLNQTADARLKGVQIHNSKDPIKAAFAPDYGGRNRIFDDVQFHNCTGTIFNIIGSDTPYFKFRDVVINCPNAIGFEFKGFTDAGIFGADTDDQEEFDRVIGKAIASGVELRAYAVGAKFYGAFQRMKFQAHFMHVGDAYGGNHIDVWIVPAPLGSVNAGVGVDFIGNWHGNEGRTATDRFFVIADQDANGRPILDKPSTGIVRGLNIERSSAFIDFPVPYVFTTADNIKGCTFGWQSRRASSNPAVVGTPFVKTLSGKPLDASNKVFKWIEGTTIAENILPEYDMGLTKEEHDALMFMRDQMDAPKKEWVDKGLWPSAKNADGEEMTLRDIGRATWRAVLGLPPD